MDPTSTGATRLQRLVRQPLFWVVVIGATFLVPIVRSVTRPLPPALPVLSTLPDFQLRDESGAPFVRHQLDGRVWVANFIFTRCPSACPLLSQKMEKIQKRTRGLGRAFHMVSISVDPEHDTPADLLAYAHRFHANPRGWSFLTGPLPDVEAAVTKGFKIAMVKEPTVAPGDAQPPADPGFFDIIHGEHLVLVDQRGRIRGYFEASNEGIDGLMAGVSQLVNQRPDAPTETPPRPVSPIPVAP